MKQQIAREPEQGEPDDDIVLLGFRHPVSSNGTKVETMLRMCGLDYTAKLGNITSAADAPKHKFPVIRHGKHLINDSTLLIKYLTKTYPAETAAIAPPDNQAAALSVAAQRLVEDHLAWAAIYGLWTPDDVWALHSKTVFEGLPGFLWLVVPRAARKQMLGHLDGQGFGRHAPEDVMKLAGDDLDALAMMLEGQDYLTGATPTEADCALFGFLDSALNTAPDTDMKKAIKARDVLLEFHKRIHDKYFADKPSSLQPTAK